MNRIALGCLVLGIAGLSPLRAQSPDTSKAAGAPGLEEIVVTAQKRSESAQDVPISMSIETAESLRDKSIVTLSDLSIQTPGYVFDNTSFFHRQSVRGFSSPSLDSLESAVVTLIDGAYIPNYRMAGAPLFDVERVELLRGPQGTLYGKNAIGGVLQIVTPAPARELSGYVSASYGSFSDRRMEGAVNVPLGDTLAVRLSALRWKRDGWIANDNPLGPPDGGGADTEAVRLRGRWTPMSNMNLDFKYEYLDHEDVGSTLQALFIDPSLLTARRFQVLPPAALDTSVDRHQWIGPNAVQAGGPMDLRTNGGQTVRANFATLRGQYDFSSGYSLISITTHSDYRNGRLFDPVAAPFAVVPLNNYQEWKTFTQELQIQSPPDARFSFVGGAFYEDSTLNKDVRPQISLIDFDGSGGLTGGIGSILVSGFAPGDTAVGQTGVNAVLDSLIFGGRFAPILNQNQGVVDRTSKSVYFEGSWKITDPWRLTAGARWTRDSQQIDKVFAATNTNGDPFASAAWIDGFVSDLANNSAVQNAAAVYADGDFLAAIHNTVSLFYSFLPPSVPDGIFRNGRDEESVTPSVRLELRPDSKSLYYLVGQKGYKAGTFNTDTISAASITEVNNETAFSVELGGKLGLMEGAAQLNFALWWTEFDDLQVNRTVPPTETFLDNAASAISKGAEFSFDWQLNQNWLTGLAYTYIDAYYDQYTDGQCPPADAPPGCLAFDRSGSPLDNAPKHSATIRAGYSVPLSASWNLYAQASLSYRSEMLVGQPNVYIDSTSTLNALLAVRGASGWELSLDGSNLTDQRDLNYRNYHPFFGSSYVHGSVIIPRQLRFIVRKSFGND